MAINLEDIKNGFFTPYKKYWVVLFLVLAFCSTKNLRSYYNDTDKITEGLIKSEYVTNAIIINDNTLLTSKSAIDNACSQYKNMKTYNRFLAFDKNNFYEVIPLGGNSIYNLILLRIKDTGQKFQKHINLQLGTQDNEINDGYYIPITTNGFGNYVFKKARLIGFRDKNYFLLLKSKIKNKNLEGLAVFDKNYSLRGIIKEKNSNYESKSNKDNLLNSMNIKRSYLTNSLNDVKEYLEANGVAYYSVSKTNLKYNKNNVQDSILNIVCINRNK